MGWQGRTQDRAFFLKLFKMAPAIFSIVAPDYFSMPYHFQVY